MCDTESPVLARPTILVAEDEPIAREAMIRFLSFKGYNVIAAADGLEAIEVFEQHNDEISICLIDMNMPLVDGGECVETIRKTHPNLPIFLLTGELDERQIDDELQKNIQMRFIKPFDWNELVEAVANTLSN